MILKLIILITVITIYVNGRPNLEILLPDFKTLLELRIDMVLNESKSFPINYKIFDNHDYCEIISGIRENFFDSANVLYDELKENISLSALTTFTYDKNLDYAAQYVSFIIHMTNETEKYRAYRLLYEDLILNGQEYSTVTTLLAYQMIDILHQNNSENINSRNFMTKIPQSLRHLDYSRPFIIRNIIDHYELFTGNEKTYDPNRRHIFTSNLQNCTTNPICQWHLTPMNDGNFLHIKNVYKNEFLYADTNNLAYDNFRRQIFTWINDTTIYDEQSKKWQLEPTKQSGYFKIKNTFYNEYLYIERESFFFNYQLTIRKVFTRRNNSCDLEGCKWQFINVPHQIQLLSSDIKLSETIDNDDTLDEETSESSTDSDLILEKPIVAPTVLTAN